MARTKLGVGCLGLCLVAIAPRGAQAGWNPFAKQAKSPPTSVSATALPKFDGEPTSGDAPNPWHDKKPSGGPRIFSRVSSGAGQMMTKTKDALSFRKQSDVVSKYPSQTDTPFPGASSKKKSGWFGSKPKGPPKTTGEFLDLDRPAF